MIDTFSKPSGSDIWTSRVQRKAINQYFRFYRDKTKTFLQPHLLLVIAEMYELMYVHREWEWMNRDDFIGAGSMIGFFPIHEIKVWNHYHDEPKFIQQVDERFRLIACQELEGALFALREDVALSRTQPLYEDASVQELEGKVFPLLSSNHKDWALLTALTRAYLRAI